MPKEFTIYYTSDTHGHIFPVNYAANCAEDGGLLNLAHKVKRTGTLSSWTEATRCKARR